MLQNLILYVKFTVQRNFIVVDIESHWTLKMILFSGCKTTVLLKTTVTKPRWCISITVCQPKSGWHTLCYLTFDINAIYSEGWTFKIICYRYIINNLSLEKVGRLNIKCEPFIDAAVLYACTYGPHIYMYISKTVLLSVFSHGLCYCTW